MLRSNTSVLLWELHMRVCIYVCARCIWSMEKGGEGVGAGATTECLGGPATCEPDVVSTCVAYTLAQHVLEAPRQAFRMHMTRWVTVAPAVVSAW